MGKQLAALAAMGILALLAGCGSSVGPPELQGSPAMVSDAGTPRLWVLTKREETRQVGSGTRRSSGLRTDTFFHFDLTAFEPVTVRPLWTKRLLTLGDPEAHGSSSRILGSAAGGTMLGQDGALVWMLINEQPMALDAGDGSVVADVAAIEQRNPELRGLVPKEARHFGFDQGLVLMSADARMFVLRGAALQAQPYTPKAAVVAEAPKRSNGKPRIVPLLPYGENPARQVRLDGQWLGLYSDKEAADAGNDKWGDKLLFPYSVHNEGALARRGFWRGSIITARNFDETFERLSDLQPVQGTPTYLNGRFVKDLATGEPMLLQGPDGVLVWHNTRIDSDGRLALVRLNADLKPVWTTELPLSESSTANPIRYQQLPGRIVAMGDLVTMKDGIQSREPHVVSVQLSDGAWQGWNVVKEAPVE